MILAVYSASETYSTTLLPHCYQSGYKTLLWPFRNSDNLFEFTTFMDRIYADMKTYLTQGLNLINKLVYLHRFKRFFGFGQCSATYPAPISNNSLYALSCVIFSQSIRCWGSITIIERFSSLGLWNCDIKGWSSALMVSMVIEPMICSPIFTISYKAATVNGCPSSRLMP